MELQTNQQCVVLLFCLLEMLGWGSLFHIETISIKSKPLFLRSFINLMYYFLSKKIQELEEENASLKQKIRSLEEFSVSLKQCRRLLNQQYFLFRV